MLQCKRIILLAALERNIPMYKSLNTKLMLIFIVFIILVMASVGIILLNSVFGFYKNDFTNQISEGFSVRLTEGLRDNLLYDDYVSSQKSLLTAYSSSFGFDSNRNFYILDMDGNILAGSSADSSPLVKTPNMLSAMNRRTGDSQTLGADYMDYALYLENGGRECIIYIKDNLTRMKTLSWMLFSIIIQALIIGLFIAVLLSFFLARAITSPILSLTKSTRKIASGDYSHRLETSSRDEIGTLTENFNTMAQVIENTLDEVSGEKEKLSKIIGCLRDGVAAFDKDGDLMFINSAALGMLGIEKNANIKFGWFTALLGVSVTMSELSEVHSLSISEQRLSGIRKGDFIVDIDFVTFTYEGTKPGYIAVVQDVTEKSLLEKSRREFIANVSHELRTPLTSIKGATETILADDDMPLSFRKKFLGIVINESDRMTRIVKDLLVLSRFDNRRMTWQPTTFSTLSSLSQMCTALKTSASQKSQTINLKAPDDLYDITADKERIEQVVTNIIGNAVKYTPEGGTIDVNAENSTITVDGNEEKAVKIKICDNGVGIPEADISRLFERFYRVDKARTSEMGGTGLGLSIAKEIVDAHRGLISIDSKENLGTAVTVVIPTECHIKPEGTV